MKALKLNDTEFEVTNDAGGHRHVVSASSCDCLDYKMRRAKVGGSCKHMVFIGTLDIKPVNADVLSFIKKGGMVEHTVLIKEFGDVQSEITNLLKRGEIFYISRMDSYRVL